MKIYIYIYITLTLVERERERERDKGVFVSLGDGKSRELFMYIDYLFKSAMTVSSFLADYLISASYLQLILYQ